MKPQNLEKKVGSLGRVGKTIAALGLAAGLYAVAPSLVSSPAYADTIYFGKLDKSTTQTVAYVTWENIKVKSKYHKQLGGMDKHDPKYTAVLEQRNKSIRDAIRKVGESTKYEVVVEKSDPEIKGYVDINNQVVAKLEEIEK